MVLKKKNEELKKETHKIRLSLHKKQDELNATNARIQQFKSLAQKK